jgi:hypothetical protein
VKKLEATAAGKFGSFTIGDQTSGIIAAKSELVYASVGELKAILLN